MDENPGKVFTPNSAAASATPNTSLKKGSIAMTESDTSLHLTESKENVIHLLFAVNFNVLFIYNAF